ncbi:hypothetical protein LOD99_12359 [Oopsacas minuta]|uniref:Uncharacterized protein n=1 Tax=Oopsacas minuta TaxID=111878 RepID=A0AAV7JFG4_9METZ|nr:hypothetical protein LOD99_12359 [Oopsacas minuta]
MDCINVLEVNRLGRLNEEVSNYKKKKYPSLVVGEHNRLRSSTPGKFNSPRSIAIDPETNNIYICDVGNDRVQIFTESLRFLFAFSDELNGPDGICIDLNNVLVTQRDSHAVNIYSIVGVFIKSVGRKGNKELEFHWPRGIAVSLDKRIYICDWANNRIQCLNFNLSFNSFFYGMKGPRDVKLTLLYIVILVENDLCVRFYDYDHQFLKEIITRGKGNQVTHSFYFCLDRECNIIMTDHSANCILIFSSRGDLLHKYGSKGDKRGDLLDPVGVALDSQNRFIVASRNSENCIQMF